MAAAALQVSSGRIVCRGWELFLAGDDIVPSSSGYRQLHGYVTKVSKPKLQECRNGGLVYTRCRSSRQEDGWEGVTSVSGKGVALCEGNLLQMRLSRRDVEIKLGAAALASLLIFAPGDAAVAVQQTLLAGRIPGLSDPDAEGLRTYRRPNGKSGGHGVGWSPIIPYSFKVPMEGWEEVPVSIADLGGTEIDLRFASPQEGNISVIVAPVLRFSDSLGDNATIERIGSPDKVINAFGPEVIGKNIEGLVKAMEVKEYEGRKYYQYELESPHVLITATAAGNRFYLLSVSANGRQWKKFAPTLKQIANSFRVDSV